MKTSLGGIKRNLGVFLKTVRLSVDLPKLIKIVTLILIAFITVAIRLQPLKYGAYISEFDPYSYYTCTKYIVDSIEKKGLNGLFDFFTWHETRTWYPFGVDMGKSYHPAHPYFGAFVYLLLRNIGIECTVEDVAIFLPVFMALISVLLVYLVGKEFGGELVGLLSALFYSVSPGVVPRSTLGWYDTEMLGMPSLIAAFYFYIRSVKKEEPFNKRAIFAVLAGLFAGVLMGSWGAADYLLGMLAVAGIILVFFEIIPERFEATHILTMTSILIFACILPSFGLRFLTSSLALLIYLSIAYVLLGRFLGLTYAKLSKLRGLEAVSFITLVMLITGAILSIFPRGIGGRKLAILNPFYKPANPLVQSVQEHAGSSFASMFVDYGVLIPLAIYGSYLLIKRKNAEEIILLIFVTSSVYFTGSFVRLSILAAPFIIVTSIYGFKHLFEEFLSKLLVTERRKRKRLYKEINYKPYLLLGLIFIIGLFPITPKIGIRVGDSPVTIASDTLGFSANTGAWLDALEWIQENTPEDSVMAAWWDYGYWLSFIANRTTLADNATRNSTRIKLLAEMFMSNETTALKILKRLDADYVVIFTTAYRFGGVYYVPAGYAEEGKFIQMVRIAGLPESRFINQTGGRMRYLPAFWNSFLGKLIPYQYSFTTEEGYDVYSRTFKYPTAQENSSAPIILVYDAQKAVNLGRDVELVIDVLIYKVNFS